MLQTCPGRESPAPAAVTNAFSIRCQCGTGVRVLLAGSGCNPWQQGTESHLPDRHRVSARLQLAVFILSLWGNCCPHPAPGKGDRSPPVLKSGRDVCGQPRPLLLPLPVQHFHPIDSIGLPSHPKKCSLECSPLPSVRLKQEAGEDVRVLIIFWVSFAHHNVAKIGRKTPKHRDALGCCLTSVVHEEGKAGLHKYGLIWIFGQCFL